MDATSQATVTLSADGEGLVEDFSEGLSDEDQVSAFGTIHDSCEVAKARRTLTAALVDPNIAGLKEQEEYGPTPGPTSKWCENIQARIRSIRGRVASSSDVSIDLHNTRAHEPSHFENFLMDVVQTEEKGADHSQGSSAPNSGKYTGEDAHKVGFDPNFPSIEGSEVLTPGNPHYSSSFNALGRHYDRLGHVAAPGTLTVENTGSLGPTNMMGVVSHHKAIMADATLGKTVAGSLMNNGTSTELGGKSGSPHIRAFNAFPFNISSQAPLMDDKSAFMRRVNGDTSMVLGTCYNQNKPQSLNLAVDPQLSTVYPSSTQEISAAIASDSGQQGKDHNDLRFESKGCAVQDCPDPELVKNFVDGGAHHLPTVICSHQPELRPVGPIRSASNGTLSGSVDSNQEQTQDHSVLLKPIMKGHNHGCNDMHLVQMESAQSASTNAYQPIIVDQEHSNVPPVKMRPNGIGKDSSTPDVAGTFGPSRVVTAVDSHNLGPTDLVDSHMDAQHSIGPKRTDQSNLNSEAVGMQVGYQLTPISAAIPSHYGCPNSDVAEPPCQGINQQTNTDNGHRKKFTELFSSTPEHKGEAPQNKGEDSTVEFPLGYVSHGPRSENRILPVPKALIDEGSNEWGTTLVGYFIGRGLPYSLVTSSTKRLWADYGLFDTLATDSGIFFFTFSSEVQRDAVLEGGPWYIAGQPFILQPWKPSLRLDKKDVQSIPIWINLYGIPLELWNPKGISFIASYIGKPLCVDRMTASRRRITYARVCVEVSGDLDLIDKFAIEMAAGENETSLLDIAVEYQWMPIRCAKCSMFGHNCNKVASKTQGYTAHRANPAQTYYPTPSLNHHNMVKQDVWQVVQKKDKGKKIVEGAELDMITIASTQRLKANNRERSPGLEGCVASSSEHILYSFNNVPTICENRTSTVPIDNSFNGLIPYVYDREDNGPLDDAEGRSLEEGSHEEDDTNENPHETAVAVAAIATPISARQKKREAKMLFSGSRPKGRHRS